jgi:catechol 2,3-dioxygenase
MIPEPQFDPPFRITRASHISLGVRDLAASRRFYTEVIGLVVTREEAGVLYLRGIEEACHHSLVLQEAAAPASCAFIGMRVLTEDDLDRARFALEGMGLDSLWAEPPHQGRSLRFRDPVGVPVELCAQMPAQPRHITSFSSHRGGCGLRLDHYQVLCPDVAQACAFWMSLGFRLSEYIAPPDGPLGGVFLQRKGNPHDIVFFNGDGPRLHHFAYLAPEVHHILRACDIAGELGYGREVERGPGRHGPGHALFAYFRDPDGHRVELFNTHYQTMDLENEPVRWSPDDPNISFPWGLPAQLRWFEDATHFVDTAVQPSPRPPQPMTLEKFLAR